MAAAFDVEEYQARTIDRADASRAQSDLVEALEPGLEVGVRLLGQGAFATDELVPFFLSFGEFAALRRLAPPDHGGEGSALLIPKVGQNRQVRIVFGRPLSTASCRMRVPSMRNRSVSTACAQGVRRRVPLHVPR